jgi:hypothetical protein
MAISAAFFGCATTYKVYPPDEAHADSLRVAEVMQIFAREQVVSSLPHTYEMLKQAGIRDASIQDGSLVAARVYCCGGTSEQRNAVFVLVPDGLAVELGDIVEVRMGRRPSDTDSGRINTATRVRESADTPASDRACRWVPENEALWMRILYCDWMEEEGWAEVGGVWPTWLKPG